VQQKWNITVLQQCKPHTYPTAHLTNTKYEMEG